MPMPTHGRVGRGNLALNASSRRKSDFDSFPPVDSTGCKFDSYSEEQTIFIFFVLVTKQDNFELWNASIWQYTV